MYFKFLIQFFILWITLYITGIDPKQLTADVVPKFNILSK